MNSDLGYWIHITGCVALASDGDLDRALQLAIDHCGEDAVSHVREYWPLATDALATVPASVAAARAIDPDLAQRIPNRSTSELAAIATQLLRAMPCRPPLEATS
jgi:hypothetical protein